MIYSASSEGKALLFSDNHIYATGTLYSNPYQLLTVNLNVDGTYSDDWANTGAGDGIRILSGSGNNVAMAISRAGSNIYITGLGDGNLVPSPPTAPNSEYISVRYTEAGTVVSPFEDYFPGNESAKVDFGTGITSFCAGQVFVTGCYYDHGSSEDYNFATLVYAQTNTEEDPEGYTITKGSYIGGNLTSLTADDSDYLVIQNGIVLITTDPRVVVEVTGTVDNDPPVSELCFEVDAHAVPNVVQQVQLYNNTSGQFDTLDDKRKMTTADLLIHVSVPGDPSKYINGSGEVKGRIRYFVVGPIFDNNWKASIDLAQFRYMQ